MSASPSTSEIWQQYREISTSSAGPFVADGSTDDLDMEIEVRDAKKEGISFTVGLWNLAPSEWGAITKGDTFTITLGWLNGPQATVCDGVVKEKTDSPDNNDTKYIIKGQALARERTKTRFSKTYEGLSPSEIASDVAENIGLGIGHVDGSATIEGRYVIRDDKPARYWFGELAREAEIRTDAQWSWDASGGEFYFVRKENTTTEAPVLAYENTLLSLEASTGKSDSDSDLELEFECLLEPQLKKGGLAAVQTDDYQGAFKVADVTHRSDTVAGEHVTTGTLVPGQSTYSIQWPGSGRIDPLFNPLDPNTIPGTYTLNDE